MSFVNEVINEFNETDLFFEKVEKDGEIVDGLWLSTFPDKDTDFSREFCITAEFFVKSLEELFNVRTLEAMEKWLDSYTWDHTWQIYLKAEKENEKLDEDDLN